MPPPHLAITLTGKYLHHAASNRPRCRSGIPYIIGNEAAERFSYYGMMAILFAFLTEYLRDSAGNQRHMIAEHGQEWTHYFIAAVYAFPISAPILSDWLFGKYRTIVSVSLLYCVGHGMLAVMDYPSDHAASSRRWMLAIGLALIALGAGGIKPCVSAHVGDQFGKQNEHLIPKVFGWFYFSINLGSAVSMLIDALAAQALRSRLGVRRARRVDGVRDVRVLAGPLQVRPHSARRQRVLSRDVQPRRPAAVVNLIPLYLLIFPFFTLFDQTHSSWVDQAKQHELHVLRL